MKDISALLVSPQSTIRDAMENMDRSGKGIVLVADADRRLLGTVTDGDVRRAILKRQDLDMALAAILAPDSHPEHPTPITVSVGTSDADILHLMKVHTLRHIPVVDDRGRVEALALLSEVLQVCELPLQAVVMAGGFGTRLMPYTKDVPKPMLPVGDRPLLEWTIAQLRQAGIRRVNVTTHYKSEVIERHFGDGQKFGVDIEYMQEDQPLGTAGALRLIEDTQDPILVINGDILTRVNFQAMLDFHRDHQADLTIAVRQFEFRVPYGVVEAEGVSVTAITEKPVSQWFVNAGIYLLNRSVCEFIPSGQAYDMPDLIQRLLREGIRVICFPVREYWLDIGKVDDYSQGQFDVANGKF